MEAINFSKSRTSKNIEAMDFEKENAKICWRNLFVKSKTTKNTLKRWIYIIKDCLDTGIEDINFKNQKLLKISKQLLFKIKDR